jgi:hypothetical protein
MKRFPLMRLIALSSLFSTQFYVSSRAADKESSPARSPEARISAAFEKLPEADRKLAELQRYCPVMPDNRLGLMGVPVKIEVAGKPVFLCCKACQEDANANPKETLATIEKLKKKTAAFAKMKAEDRATAEAQRVCPILDGSRLGSMGVPVKVVIRGKPVFLCCEGCRDEALAHPDETLAKVETSKVGKAKAEK